MKELSRKLESMVYTEGSAEPERGQEQDMCLWWIQSIGSEFLGFTTSGT